MNLIDRQTKYLPTCPTKFNKLIISKFIIVFSSSGERSTKLLVGIVVVFLVCHVSRLVIQIEAIIHPSTVGEKQEQ